MLKLPSSLAIAGALLSLTFLGATPALALSSVTFVSGNGADNGTCASPTAPCRTFQFALGQTKPGGEIKALGPANYSGVTINKSISITGVEGAGIFQPIAGSNAITINAGPNDIINLSHLTLDGFKTANRGIELNSGGSLSVSHCIVRNFLFDGILLFPMGSTAFLIADTIASNNNDGVSVVPQATGTAHGTLDHVFATNNLGIGIGTGGSGGPSTVLAVESIAAQNSIGFFVNSGKFLRLGHSAATGNGTGVQVSGRAESAGNNFVRGNGTDVAGPLPNVGTQ
jgi:hypothetical protein